MFAKFSLSNIKNYAMGYSLPEYEPVTKVNELSQKEQKWFGNKEALQNMFKETYEKHGVKGVLSILEDRVLNNEFSYDAAQTYLKEGLKGASRELKEDILQTGVVGAALAKEYLAEQPILSSRALWEKDPEYMLEAVKTCSPEQLAGFTRALSQVIEKEKTSGADIEMSDRYNHFKDAITHRLSQEEDKGQGFGDKFDNTFQDIQNPIVTLKQEMIELMTNAIQNEERGMAKYNEPSMSM